MNKIIIEIPYGHVISIDAENAGFLTNAVLLKTEGYGTEKTFTKANPALHENIELALIDEGVIKPYEQPPVAPDGTEPEATLAPVAPATAEDDLTF